MHLSRCGCWPSGWSILPPARPPSASRPTRRRTICGWPLLRCRFRRRAFSPVMLAAVWWHARQPFRRVGRHVRRFRGRALSCRRDDPRPELFGWIEPVGLVDLAKSLGIEKAALAAVPVGLLLIVLVSLITPAPTAAQREFANALRSPRDMLPPTKPSRSAQAPR